MSLKKYSVRITDDFIQDTIEVSTRIRIEYGNPIAAERLLERVRSAIEKRSEDPLMFPPYPYITKSNDIYYHINVGNYSVFYVIIDDVMDVRRFIYARRSIGYII